MGKTDPSKSFVHNARGKTDAFSRFSLLFRQETVFLTEIFDIWRKY